MTKYGKQFKKEEQEEKKEFNRVVKEKKQKVREEFLSNFFLPLRKEFESKVDEFQKLWPLKEEDFLEEE